MTYNEKLVAKATGEVPEHDCHAGPEDGCDCGEIKGTDECGECDGEGTITVGEHDEVEEKPCICVVEAKADSEADTAIKMAKEDLC